MRFTSLVQIFVALILAVVSQAQPYAFRPYKLPKNALPEHLNRNLLEKRSNAELINGLIGMDLNTLQAVGKRSNAELINGLIGMDLNRLSAIGKRR